MAVCDRCYYDRKACENDPATGGCRLCKAGECFITPNRPRSTRPGDPGHITTRNRLIAFKAARDSPLASAAPAQGSHALATLSASAADVDPVLAPSTTSALDLALNDARVLGNLNSAFEQWVLHTPKDSVVPMSQENIFMCCNEVKRAGEPRNQSERELGFLVERFAGQYPDHLVDTSENGVGYSGYDSIIQVQSTACTDITHQEGTLGTTAALLSNKTFLYSGIMPDDHVEFIEVIGNGKPEVVRPINVGYLKNRNGLDVAYRDILGDYLFRLPFTVSYTCTKHPKRIWNVYELAYWCGKYELEDGFVSDFGGDLELRLKDFVTNMIIPREIGYFDNAQQEFTSPASKKKIYKMRCNDGYSDEPEFDDSDDSVGV